MDILKQCELDADRRAQYSDSFRARVDNQCNMCGGDGSLRAYVLEYLIRSPKSSKTEKAKMQKLKDASEDLYTESTCVRCNGTGQISLFRYFKRLWTRFYEDNIVKIYPCRFGSCYAPPRNAPSEAENRSLHAVNQHGEYIHGILRRMYDVL
jgi:hypothetical protein